MGNGAGGFLLKGEKHIKMGAIVLIQHYLLERYHDVDKVLLDV